MRINIDGEWRDVNDGPLIVELTETDKINIMNMSPECTLYAQFADSFGSEEKMRDYLELQKTQGALRNAVSKIA